MIKLCYKNPDEIGYNDIFIVEINSVDAGYVALSCAIVGPLFRGYEEALKKYKETKNQKYLLQIQSYEVDIMSQFYQIITLFQLDPDNYIKYMRGKYRIQLDEKLVAKSNLQDKKEKFKKSYYSSYKEKLKTYGICVDCGKNRARPGKTTCFDCSVKRSDRYHKKKNSK